MQRDIFVIGASAGGIETLRTLVAELPKNLPAAIFVVVHIPAYATSALPLILERAGDLPADHARDNQPLRMGAITIAPPDHHMLLHRDLVRLSRGPRENGHRPAVDPLFRSAAEHFGPRVTGIVLSGGLDDGTAGLLAIKERGGLAIVQDPDEAMHPSMPRSAMESVHIDRVLTAVEIGQFIAAHAGDEIPGMNDREPMQIDQADDDFEHELRMAEMERKLIPPGSPSVFGCPECGGTLWELDEGVIVRYRCRVGHSYSAKSLLAAQSDQLEDAFWVALRALEESAALARRMAQRAAERHATHTQRHFETRAREAEANAELVRRVLEHGVNLADEPSEADM